MSPLGRSIWLAHSKSRRCTSFKLYYTPRWWARLSGSNCTAHGTDVRPQGVLGSTLYVLWMHWKKEIAVIIFMRLIILMIHNRWDFFLKWEKVDYGYIRIRIPQAVRRKCWGKCMLVALSPPLPVAPIWGEKNQCLCDTRLVSSHLSLHLSLSSSCLLQRAEKTWKFQAQFTWFPLDIYL